MNMTLTFYICIFDNKLHVCPHFYWRSTMLLLPVRHWALFSLYFFLSFFCFLTFFHGFAHTISNNPTRQPSSLNLWPVCFAWLGPWHALHPHTHKKKVARRYLSLSLDAVLSQRCLLKVCRPSIPITVICWLSAHCNTFFYFCFHWDIELG